MYKNNLGKPPKANAKNVPFLQGADRFNDKPKKDNEEGNNDYQPGPGSYNLQGMVES